MILRALKILSIPKYEAMVVVVVVVSCWRRRRGGGGGGSRSNRPPRITHTTARLLTPTPTEKWVLEGVEKLASPARSLVRTIFPFVCVCVCVCVCVLVGWLTIFPCVRVCICVG
ncbi:hypothetical protein E2C01_089802 [Portunus trituberculatus]|uniref:Uncharacterized protein n=1 Tax=Portunus trituberculatus TaxID=210409 RepID=A0A5B7JK39_PORTR|nr:hypothetical protein [Portunus trituberculatus]